MCLSYIIRKESAPESGYGWKRLDGMRSPIMGFRFTYAKWIKSRSTQSIPYATSGQYRSGFHIWLDIPSDSLFYGGRYTRVKFRGGHTIGMDGGTRTVIADEIYIPRKIKKSIRRGSK